MMLEILMNIQNLDVLDLDAMLNFHSGKKRRTVGYFQFVLNEMGKSIRKMQMERILSEAPMDGSSIIEKLKKKNK
jgi:hypothetical protein